MDTTTNRSEKLKKLIAIALQYDDIKDMAPKVIAKGEGLLADKILDLARKHHIPIESDEDLASILSVIEIGDFISPQSYMVVSEIFSKIYQLNKQKYL